MNKITFPIKMVLGILVILLFIQAKWVQAAFQAGIAVRDVTPQKMLAVSGGIGPSEPVTKIIGKLTVRALVLADDDTKVAICSTDFLGFPGVLCDKVRKQVKGILPDNILIGATHQHSGPDCYGFRNEKGETAADLEYLDDVCRKLAEAINEANQKLQAVGVKIATENARGKIAYNAYAERLYDPRCHVMQFVGSDGKAVATLINYACHPEVIGADQGIMSPDFVGPLYDRISERGGGVGIYMNGALGGMVTADCRDARGRDVQRWDECVRIGNLLADESLRIVMGAAIQKDPDLYCDSTTIKFPIDNPLMRMILKTSPLATAR